MPTSASYMHNVMSLERNHLRCCKHFDRGERHRWVSCLAASRIVGRYEHGATRRLAEGLGCSVDYVERLAKAGIAYRSLRRFRPRSEDGKLASPKHFYTMWDLWYKHEFSPREAAEQLRVAAEEGVSVEQMSLHVRNEHEPPENEYNRFCADIQAARKRLETAVGRDVEIDSELREALLVAVTVVKDICDTLP